MPRMQLTGCAESSSNYHSIETSWNEDWLLYTYWHYSDWSVQGHMTVWYVRLDEKRRPTIGQYDWHWTGLDPSATSNLARLDWDRSCLTVLPLIWRPLVALNTQFARTTLLRQSPAVRRVPAFRHLQLIPTSLHGCAPSSESDCSHTLVTQPGIRYQLAFVPELVEQSFKKLLKAHFFNLAFSS